MTPWASPRMNVSGCGPAEREGADQQRQVDVEWTNDATSSRRKVTKRISPGVRQQPREPAQRLVGVVGPALDIGGPPGEVVVLGVRRDRRSLGQPGQPHQHDDPARELHQRLDASAAPALTDHSSASSRASVSAGFSPTSTEPAAPSAQRSAQVASQAARRPASQRPSADAHDAQRRQALRGVVGQQAQRPADGLALQAERCRCRPRSPPAGRRARRGWASRGRAARPAPGRPRRSPPAAARTAPRTSCTSMSAGRQGPRARMPGGSVIGVDGSWG